MSAAYITQRLNNLIAEGERVLRSYNQKGNIDSHDLWFTETKNFLSVNAPQFVERLHSVAPKYREALLLEPRGRAAYNLIQEQLEVLKLARANFDAQPADPHPSEIDVIVLVHGIRDYALWQNAIRDVLEVTGFTVEATNYGRFNLVQFLLPVRYFRKRAIDAVWRQIRVVKQNHPDSRISVIAHSFGTIVISHLMRQNFDIQFHRILFCGSVVPYAFEYEQIQNRFTPPIINEVGTRDVWPAMAESVTWGYGSAGTYGFRRPLVRDRWHNGARHGYFLDRSFCERFWVPFLKTGTIVPGAELAERPRTWIQLISIFKLKYFLVLVAVLCILAIWLSSVQPQTGNSAPTSRVTSWPNQCATPPSPNQRTNDSASNSRCDVHFSSL